MKDAERFQSPENDNTIRLYRGERNVNRLLKFLRRNDILELMYRPFMNRPEIEFRRQLTYLGSFDDSEDIFSIKGALFSDGTSAIYKLEGSVDEFGLSLLDLEYRIFDQDMAFTRHEPYFFLPEKLKTPDEPRLGLMSGKVMTESFLVMRVEDLSLEITQEEILYLTDAAVRRSAKHR